jgi:hypothetical protein
MRINKVLELYYAPHRRRSSPLVLARIALSYLSPFRKWSIPS